MRCLAAQRRRGRVRRAATPPWVGCSLSQDHGSAGRPRGGAARGGSPGGRGSGACAGHLCRSRWHSAGTCAAWITWSTLNPTSRLRLRKRHGRTEGYWPNALRFHPLFNPLHVTYPCAPRRDSLPLLRLPARPSSQHHSAAACSPVPWLFLRRQPGGNRLAASCQSRAIGSAAAAAPEMASSRVSHRCSG